MERVIEVWKIFWPEGIPRSAFQKALALAALAMDEGTKRPAAIAFPAAAPSADGAALTVNEIAAKSGAVAAVVYDAIRRGSMHATRINGRMRVPVAEADAWTAKYRPRPGSATTAAPPPDSPAAAFNPAEAITLSDIGARLGITESALKRYVYRTKELRGRTVKRRLIIARADAEAFIAKMQAKRAGLNGSHQ